MRRSSGGPAGAGRDDRTGEHMGVSGMKGAIGSLPEEHAMGSRITALLGSVPERARGALAAGEHVAAWDGRDERGRAVPCGLYFVRLVAAGRSFTQRPVTIREEETTSAALMAPPGRPQAVGAAPASTTSPRPG